MKHPGLLITLEGGEGGGKTTQVARLLESITELGYTAISLREPGGTVISEQIRDVVLSPKNVDMAFTTEVLLFQAARAQIYGQIVLPALSAGTIVLMDRSRDSSVVYQGIVREFGVSLVNELNDISTNKTYPDLTFLLDLPAELGMKRRADDGGVDRLDMQSKVFHEKVRAGYLELAKQNEQRRWHVIDATQTIETVHEEMLQILTAFLQQKPKATT